MRARISEQLAKYLPASAVELCTDWVINYKIQVKVAAPRSTKRGDYRHPFQNRGHRISVNGDLNPYSFLITFTHEVAHLIVWNNHRNSVLPHGLEWQQTFAELLRLLLKMDIFPSDIKTALLNYIRKPKASTASDAELFKVLEKYEEPDPALEGLELYYVEELNDGTIFRMENGRIFKKIHKLRKYFLCEEIPSKSLFRINPLARVVVCENMNH
ncbi:SprT family zinc-dependent metalloprotease [Sediminitomix flava]|uniref:SprT-like family protein n=1 Tax=Sediminitomix flava TaxID=379075 RepID=A0A315ZH02_SEDFL|nr:sprT domain-containing protein [Sediminitomix flava]PWJ44449.1 hypothetical protein BC781_101809 [Sediminitomix flava]